MTYFYTSSPRTALTQKQVDELTPHTDPQTLTRLTPTLAAIKHYDSTTSTLQLHRLKMTLIERLLTSISLLVLFPLSYVFSDLSDRVSQYREGFWLVYSVVPLQDKRAPSVAGTSAAAQAAGLTPSSLATATAPAVSGGGGAGAGSLTAIQHVLANPSSIFDRDIQRDVFKKLGEASIEERNALIRLIFEQAPAKVHELTALLREADPDRFVAQAPQARELFTSLFKLLYLAASDVESKALGDIEICNTFLFAEAAYSSQTLYRALVDTKYDASIDFPGFALPLFATIARAFTELPISQQVLIDADYACSLLEYDIPNFTPKDALWARPLAPKMNESSNVGYILLACLRNTCPYVAGRFYMQNILMDRTTRIEELAKTIHAAPPELRSLPKYQKVTEFVAEIIKGYQAFSTISYFGIRVSDWPADIPNHIRALFDHENKANVVEDPWSMEIATTPAWRLIHVPQETGDIARSTIGRVTSEENGGFFFAGYHYISEASAVGYALLAPLATTGRPYEEIYDHIEHLQRSTLERLGIAGPLTHYFTALFAESASEIHQLALNSLVAADKAKSYLATALASNRPIEKLLADRNFLKHLYYYLWFLTILSSLPTPTELQRLSVDRPEDDPLTEKMRTLAHRLSLRNLSLEKHLIAGKSILTVTSPAAVTPEMMDSHYVLYIHPRHWTVSIALPRE